MKPVIRNILRSAVYQLLFMDSVPDSAACNEAVKLAQKRGFYSLKGFVNGVLRTISREARCRVARSGEGAAGISVCLVFSAQCGLVKRWTGQFGYEVTERMAADFLRNTPPVSGASSTGCNQEMVVDSLKKAGDFRYPCSVPALCALHFRLWPSAGGKILCRWEGSRYRMSVPCWWRRLRRRKKGTIVIDLCAAPGGKSLHVADKMEGSGQVEARDLTDYKVELIRENI